MGLRILVRTTGRLPSAPSKCANVARTSRRFNSTSSTSSSLSSETLSWQEYLVIRGRKRYWELGATIPSTLLAFGSGVAYFGSKDIDPSQQIFGFDPMYVYIVGVIACGGAGYLVGPAIGSSLWRLTHRKTMNLIEAKDREFYRRIVKNRANPIAQSATNPVPDYYGEKIGSLHQYRQWLRDQAKYKKKAAWLEE